MKQGVDKLLALKERLKRAKLRFTGGIWNIDLIRTIELDGMLDIALATATGALARTGVARLALTARLPDPGRRAVAAAHHRSPPARRRPPRLDYKPVELGLFEPEERKY